MKCTTCKYYYKEKKYCMALRIKVQKKKSCWAYKKKPTEIEQAFKVLKGGD